MRPFVPAAILLVCCMLPLAAQAPLQRSAKCPMTFADFAAVKRVSDAQTPSSDK